MINWTNGRYWNEDKTAYITQDVQDYADKFNIKLEEVPNGIAIIDYKHFLDYVRFIEYLIYDTVNFKQIDGKVTILFTDDEEELY